MNDVLDLQKRLSERGFKLTGPRKVILETLAAASDHPDVEQLHKRVQKRDSKIGIATVYRTVRLLEETGVIDKHMFGDGRARYEEIGDEHHDHLIDVHDGKVIEFSDPEIECRQEAIAKELGYTLVGHKLELYCIPIKKKKP